MNIAIVGGHRGTRLQAPFDDPAWSIWGFSYRNRDALPRVDAWFELHPLESLEPYPLYREWLRGLPRVFMRHRSEEYPGSQAYPRDAMVADFGDRFFTCTACWMLALAIVSNPLEIGLWGVTGQDEYASQKWAIRHFAQIAEDEGIRVTSATDILDPAKLYGYET